MSGTRAVAIDRYVFNKKMTAFLAEVERYHDRLARGKSALVGSFQTGADCTVRALQTILHDFRRFKDQDCMTRLNEVLRNYHVSSFDPYEGGARKLTEIDVREECRYEKLNTASYHHRDVMKLEEVVGALERTDQAVLDYITATDIYFRRAAPPVTIGPVLQDCLEKAERRTIAPTMASVAAPMTGTVVQFRQRVLAA